MWTALWGRGTDFGQGVTVTVCMVVSAAAPSARDAGACARAGNHGGGGGGGRHRTGGQACGRKDVHVVVVVMVGVERAGSLDAAASAACVYHRSRGGCGTGMEMCVPGHVASHGRI